MHNFGNMLRRPGCVGDSRCAMFRCALMFVLSVGWIVRLGCLGFAIQVLNYLVYVR